MAALVSASGGSSDGRWFGREAAVAGTWLGFGGFRSFRVGLDPIGVWAWPDWCYLG